MPSRLFLHFLYFIALAMYHPVVLPSRFPLACFRLSCNSVGAYFSTSGSFWKGFAQSRDPPTEWLRYFGVLSAMVLQQQLLTAIAANKLSLGPDMTLHGLFQRCFL